MTTENFSNEFDVLLDSYRRFKAYDDKEVLDSIEVNEYEKSVFLSQAQSELVMELYSGRNNRGISFESDEESRRLLHDLTRQETFEINSSKATINKPDDLWFITNESALLEDNNLPCNTKEVLVVPTKQDSLQKILNNPFRQPNDNKVLRTDRNNSIQLLSKYNIKTYTMDYIKHPNPIIVTYLNGLDVEGCSVPQKFELDSSLKGEILDRAVRIALRAKGITNNNN